MRYWRWEHRVGRWFFQTCPSNLPVPRLAWYWDDEPGPSGWLSVELGSSGCDPVVGADVDLTLPSWLARLLNWWGDCQECGVWLGLARSQTHAHTCSRYH